ncbi:MAG: patatin-like phospholipase family protein [Syntrophobacteria bacterium]
MVYHFENLVFEGGGVKGLAFCGALEILEQRGVMAQVKRLAGSSAGAITAGLLACNYTAEEIILALKDKDFNDFKDDDFGIFRDVKRLMTEFGFYAGKEFYLWYGELLAKKAGDPDVTFLDVFERYGKELVVTGTCLNRRETHYYTKERNARMPVRDAVRISMSIPLFFAAVEWQGDLLVDGGALNNYPVWVFDGAYSGDPKGRHGEPNLGTLGLKLLTEEEVEESVSGRHLSNGIYNLKDYALALVDCLTAQIDRLHIKPGDWKRTIAINTRHIKTTQFDMWEDEKTLLLEEGRQGAESFFAWYDLQHS